jgi:hypothetical protein
MNISSTATPTSLASLLGSSQTTLTSLTNATDSSTDTSATQRTGGHHHHHGGGGAKALFDALEQTLTQLGLSSQTGTTAAPPSAATASSTAAAGSVTSATAGNGQDVGTAVRAFMHALFQAAQADGGSNAVSQTTATTATGGQAYGDMSSKLQDVLQNLASGGTVAASASSTGSSADASLDTAFQNLLQTLGSSTATNSDSSTVPVSLQSFAQDLLQNLQTGGANPFENAGSLTSTTV